MQLIDRLLLLSLIAAPSAVVGFTAPVQSSKVSAYLKSSSSLKQSTNSAQNESESDNSVQYLSSRREVFGRSAAAAIAASALITDPSISNADIEGVATVPFTTAAPEATSNTGGVTVYKTKSGLQFIDLVEGTGPLPRYGNFVTISYKAYIKLPDIKGTP